MKVSNQEIAQRLENLLVELDSSRYLINPFFRISKGTTEQMKIYSFLNSRFSRLGVLVHLMISIPMNIIKIHINIFCSLILYHQYKCLNQKLYRGDILFLSHAIGANISKQGEDQFFALMPKFLKKQNRKVSIIYTNHSLINFNKNLKSLRVKNPEIDCYLIPKFLKPVENFDYLKSVISASFRCTLYGLKKIISNPIDSGLLFKCAITFYSRSTYSNYLVAQRVQEYCTENDIKVLIMTFEGHSYEQYTIDKIHRVKPNLLTLMYQHSPVVLDHFGIEYFLRKNTKSIMILTTGSMYEKLFESYSKIPRYKVLGSSKATSSFMVKSETFQNQALFAPEGTTISTVRYLKLINYLCSTNSELKLTIRFHPNLKANLTINYLVKKLRSKSNFFVSTNSLDEDLKQSKFVFYRSSAVGVLSLMSDATPVFYGDPIEVGLNALGKYSALFPVVTTQKEAAKLLNQEPISMSKKDRTRLFNEYFSRIDYSLLDSLV